MLCGLPESFAKSVRVEGRRAAWQIKYLAALDVSQEKRASDEEVRTEAVAELCVAFLSAN